MEKQTLALLGLALIKGLGPKSARNLIAYCGSPEAVFEAQKAKLLKIPGIGPKIAEALRNKNTQQMAETEWQYCRKAGIRVLSYLDSDYPSELSYIHDAPIVLFCRGAGNLNTQPNLAIVGTRKASEYGKEQTLSLASFFAKQGFNIVSGLAFGIDIAAHRAALHHDGMTTAVLAHGLHTIYPRHHARKAREIETKGLLLSEYPSHAPIDPGNFPARNRLISGLCKAVIVVEAGISGGALITARFAFDQNKEVYATPGRIGDPFSAGCNHLIRDNIAKLLTCPEEILEDMDIQWRDHPPLPSQLSIDFDHGIGDLSPDGLKVMRFLSRGDALVDSICLYTGIPISHLNSLLLFLEFQGFIRQMPGKKFKKL